MLSGEEGAWAVQIACNALGVTIVAYEDRDKTTFVPEDWMNISCQEIGVLMVQIYRGGIFPLLRR